MEFLLDLLVQTGMAAALVSASVAFLRYWIPRRIQHEFDKERSRFEHILAIDRDRQRIRFQSFSDRQVEAMLESYSTMEKAQRLVAEATCPMQWSSGDAELDEQRSQEQRDVAANAANAFNDVLLGSRPLMTDAIFEQFEQMRTEIHRIWNVRMHPITRGEGTADWSAYERLRHELLPLISNEIRRLLEDQPTPD